MSEVFRGLGVSSGVGVGQVLLHQPETLPVVPVPVPPERIDEEVGRFEWARERARTELQTLRKRTLAALGERFAGMLDAQLVILDDPSLVTNTVQRIRIGRVSARWALKEVVAEFIRRFQAMDDGYLRDRGGDLDDVHRRLQRLLSGSPSLARVQPGAPAVLVAHTLGPSDAVALPLDRVVAIVTDVGGTTSHTAILAQALSLPAVVGLHDVSLRLRAGDTVIVDGDRGEVLWLPDDAEVDAARERREAWLAHERRLVTAGPAPAVTRDGLTIHIRANIEFPEQIERALSLGAEGIGLYRSEFLFLSRAPGLPTEEQHYRAYRELAERVAPHPAVIRTLDLGGEKYFHEVLDREEVYPVLGLRGIRLCLRRPDIFRPQLRGLLRAGVHGDVRIMIPLVTGPLEIREVRRLLAEEAANLRDAGTSCRDDLPVGIMVEVPAAATTADLLARECDFFSIGTNDLVQYALAADRDNESVAYLAQPLHPAVLRLIRFVTSSGSAQGIPVALCGQMAADPAVASLLLGLGLRELSVQPRAVPGLRAVIGSLDSTEASRVADHVLGRATAEEVARYLESHRPLPAATPPANERRQE